MKSHIQRALTRLSTTVFSSTQTYFRMCLLQLCFSCQAPGLTKVVIVLSFITAKQGKMFIPTVSQSRLMVHRVPDRIEIQMSYGKAYHSAGCIRTRSSRLVTIRVISTYRINREHLLPSKYLRDSVIRFCEQFHSDYLQCLLYRLSHQLINLGQKS